MKKLVSIIILILLVCEIKSQTNFNPRLVGTVANWRPASVTDTSFYSNLTFIDGNYQVGASYRCKSCDSLYLIYEWANDNMDTLYFSAPMVQRGVAVDSIFINGTENGGFYINGTPFPYHRIRVNQVGNTKPELLYIRRNKILLD